MGAAGATAPAVDDVTLGFCAVDKRDIAAEWAVHWASSSSAMARISWQASREKPRNFCST
jgi:hypothetical protein